MDHRDALVRTAVFWRDKASARFAACGGELMTKLAATRRDATACRAIYTLSSVAQFEAEVIGGRVRDEVAAWKKKGMWMGGIPPLGYRAQDGKLLMIEIESEIVRMIFRRYGEIGSVRLLKYELDAQAIKS